MSSLEAARAATLMQEYIETKLREPITLRELSSAAGYSPWHAARLFKEATGLSPFEYIRSRRLTKAALLLRDGHERVIDVALDFVFDTYRYYHKEQNVLKEEKDLNEKTVKAIFVQIIERPARKALLLRGKEAEDYPGEVS